ncbi:hypothetical protein BC936DRAFT_138705 [Jimgerdemannia flammicorona]|uniref:Uncharacterized protein n=1 Tax=Jimgerdemannia flammicorona TaxID=994334 RepID=A0A433DI90_9FUNG|nr:hypothetical protein BC936DRAFT_138705 [Jimgerdemannia flammicorona]
MNSALDPNDKDKESLLPSVHSANPRKNKNRTISFTHILASSVLFVLTLGIITFVVAGGLQLNLAFQTPPAYTPNEYTCSCDCWDRQFKGNYIDSTRFYRNVYFNMNRHTVYVFAWTLGTIMLLEKFIERSLMCVITGGVFRGLRWGVLICAMLSFYAMFYNWWITWNYLNDQFCTYNPPSLPSTSPDPLPTPPTNPSPSSLPNIPQTPSSQHNSSST